VLIALVTVETLLLTAFTVVVLIAGRTAGGHNVSLGTVKAVALLLAAVLVFVAVGASLAWWQAFVEVWPKSEASRTEAIAALAGIVVQPVVACVFCRDLL
jgi:hypothetical protein